MRWLTLPLLMFMCTTAWPKSLSSNNDFLVLEVFRTETGSVDLYAHNKLPVPVSAVITAKGKGVNKKTLAVFKPMERKVVLSFRSDESKGTISFTNDVAWGNVLSNNSYVYRMPFKDGVEALVTQSFGDNRKSSHYKMNDPSSEYAIDFAAPSGTAIVAARAGVVVGSKYDETFGCFEDKCVNKGNYVLIVHSDGTLSQYAHLKHSQPIVSHLQSVKAGDLIGFLGGTGYASGEHLHFEVGKPEWTGRDFRIRRLPVELTDGNRIFRAKTGETYSFISKGRLISGINEK